jgi:hypothetical protein
VRALTRRDLSRFFGALASRLPCRVTLVLTGGGEALLLGGRRPTGDIDFGVNVHARDRHRWPDVEAAIAATTAETGIAVRFSDDIDRRSSVSVPAGRRTSRRLRTIGSLDVRLLDPACWAIYKLARYLDSDVEDLVAVLRNARVPWLGLARLCGVALRSSPRSTQLGLFRHHVEHFFRIHGSAVWGRRFDEERAVRTFRRAGTIPVSFDA